MTRNNREMRRYLSKVTDQWCVIHTGLFQATRDPENVCYTFMKMVIKGVIN